MFPEGSGGPSPLVKPARSQRGHLVVNWLVAWKAEETLASIHFIGLCLTRLQSELREG